MSVPSIHRRFYGNYEGKVLAVYDIDNPPPENYCPEAQAGWLKVSVPRFLGTGTMEAPEGGNGENREVKFIFARPETPFSGADGIGTLLLPPVGSKVIIYFVAGDTFTYPVWKGGLWNKAEKSSPPELATKDRRVLIYDEEGNTIYVSKKEGEIKIHVESKNVEIIAEEDVTVTAGKNATINAEGDVNVNGENVNVSGSRISLN